LLHINFIAERVAERRRTARLARTGLRLTLLAGVLLLIPPFVLDTMASNRATRLRQTRYEREKYAVRAAEHRRLKAELARLQEPRRIAVGVHANNAQWLDLLRELRNRLPQGVWYTRLALQEPLPGPGGALRQTVLMEGAADQHQAIGALVKALTESPWVATAELQRSGPQQKDAAAAPFAFRIELQLRRPIPELAGEAPR